MNEKNFSADLGKTLMFLEEIKHRDTLADLAASVKKISSGFGVSKVLAGFMPQIRSLPAEQLKNVLLADWPEDWANIYFHNGYIFVDPTIRRVKQMDTAFFWSDFSNGTEISRKEKFVMDQAREHDLKDGCTIPLVSLDGRRAGFSFAGVEIDLSPEARGAMNLVATFAFGRAIELRFSEARQTAKLTVRELEVLKWLGAGKTDWEISVILGVSEKTIEKHILKIRMKLNAVNRYHALAEAFRQNIIN